MARIVPFITALVLLFPLRLTAQYNEELEKRNGFKDLKLGMAIDSVRGSKLRKEFLEKGEFPAKTLFGRASRL